MAVSKKRNNLLAKQQEFDVKKWLESESVGYDLCGDFVFCIKCDKTLENPCAAAYDAFHTPPATAKKAAARKPKAEPAPPVLAAKPVKPPSEKSRGATTRNRSARPDVTEEIAATVLTTRNKSKN